MIVVPRQNSIRAQNPASGLDDRQVAQISGDSIQTPNDGAPGLDLETWDRMGFTPPQTSTRQAARSKRREEVR